MYKADQESQNVCFLFIEKKNCMALVVSDLVHTIFWHSTSTAYSYSVNIDLSLK